MHINENTNTIFNFNRNVSYFTVAFFLGGGGGEGGDQQLFKERVVKCIVTHNPMIMRT